MVFVGQTFRFMYISAYVVRILTIMVTAYGSKEAKGRVFCRGAVLFISSTHACGHASIYIVISPPSSFV